MFKNFENFIYSSEDKFPKESCTIQNKRESNVFDSKDVYMVLWIDTRFKNEKNITYATPYVCKEKEKTSFGWVSKDGGMVLGNVENSCQFYDEFVIGFIKVNDEYMDNDEKLFDEYVIKIEDNKEEQ